LNQALKYNSNYNYDQAFCRNRGWISDHEFNLIKNFKIAIAGVGGVGGSHLMSLVRMGFSQFVISDPDEFEIQNFNRQHWADITTIGQNKCIVMRDLALKVNPKARIEIIEGAITDGNLNQFLDCVDLYVDGLDLFALNIRQKIFELARVKKIPAVTSAPLGFGASCIIFDETSMSFNDYFQFVDHQPLSNVLKFVLGLSPSLMQVKSLVDRKYSNLAQGKTSSTPAGCLAASSLVCTEAIKILLNRGPKSRAPTVTHYDFYLNRFQKNFTWAGLKNPFMQLKLYILKKMIQRVNEKVKIN
jgi:tRNA threonylcarbamoyladenosine dehydratase